MRCVELRFAELIVEARKVETSDEEKRNVDLLFIEARCQRSPNRERTH